MVHLIRWEDVSVDAASTVTGSVGSSAATGGTVTGVFTYKVVDAGLEG